MFKYSKNFIEISKTLATVIPHGKPYIDMSPAEINNFFIAKKMSAKLLKKLNDADFKLMQEIIIGMSAIVENVSLTKEEYLKEDGFLDVNYERLMDVAELQVAEDYMSKLFRHNVKYDGNMSHPLKGLAEVKFMEVQDTVKCATYMVEQEAVRRNVKIITKQDVLEEELNK